MHRGYEANYPLVAMQVAPHEGTLLGRHSFVSVAPANVILTAVKKAEDSNALLFRMYESTGKQSDVTLDVPKGGTAATITDLMEQPMQGESVSMNSGRVSFTIHPYEIETIEVVYPASKQMQSTEIP